MTLDHAALIVARIGRRNCRRDNALATGHLMLEKFRRTQAFQIAVGNEASRCGAHVIGSKRREGPSSDGRFAKRHTTALDSLLADASRNLRNVHEIAFRARIDDDGQSRRGIHIFNDFASDTAQCLLQHGRASHFLNFGRHLQLQNIEGLALLFMNDRLNGFLRFFRLDRVSNGNADGVLRQVLDENALGIRDEFGSRPRTVALPNLLDESARRCTQSRLAETARQKSAL